MKKICLLLCFAFAFMFMLTGCGGLSGTWSVGVYTITYNDGTYFEYTTAQADEFELVEGENLSLEDQAKNYIIAIHESNTSLTMKFNGDKLVMGNDVGATEYEYHIDGDRLVIKDFQGTFYYNQEENSIYAMMQTETFEICVYLQQA